MLVANGNCIPVDVSDAVLFDKYTAQKYYPTKGEFVHDFIHFDFDNESEKKEFSSIPFSTVLRMDNHTKVSDTLSLISHYLLLNSSSSRSIVNHLGHAFLLMVRDSVNVPNNAYLSELLSLRNEIHNNPQLDWSVEAMTRKVSMSRSRLQAQYHKTFGISCMNDVISSRIEMAKKLLAVPEITISQTAELCGYKNVEHFVRQFKNRELTTPGNFKRCCQKN